MQDAPLCELDEKEGDLLTDLVDENNANPFRARHLLSKGFLHRGAVEGTSDSRAGTYEIQQ